MCIYSYYILVSNYENIYKVVTVVTEVGGSVVKI